MKRRHEVYIEEDLSERLATMAAKPSSSKTAIMTDALRAYFDQRASTELDERFRARSTGCRSSLAASSATSRSWRRRWLSLPDFSSCSLLLFRVPIAQRGDWLEKRFKLFIEQVTRRISNGRGLIEDVLSLTSPAEANYEVSLRITLTGTYHRHYTRPRAMLRPRPPRSTRSPSEPATATQPRAVARETPMLLVTHAAVVETTLAQRRARAKIFF
jgi:hypothetical protein